MITSIFNKTTPFNYSIIALFVLLVFFTLLFTNGYFILDYQRIGLNIVLFLTVFSSLFLVNFIAKKNALTKDSAFAILLYFLLEMYFPKVLVNEKLLLSNFLILLAYRRLIGLQTLKNPKQKIFDASVFILVASLFNYWCLLFFILVYASIIFHASLDYRNWLIPIFAFITFGSIFLFATLYFNQNWVSFYLKSNTYNLDIEYFSKNIENIAFSVFAVLVFFFLFNAVFTVTSKPFNLQDSYKKMIIGFFIGIAIFVLSPQKSNEMLIYTFFPLSIMITNYIEYSQNKINQNLALISVMIAGILLFVFQL